MVARRGFACGLALALSVVPAHADDDDQDQDDPPRIGVALTESITFQAIIAALYWHQTYEENVDADLHWDIPSWADKLSFDAVRFDTNPFYMNAVRHPLMSIVHYQIGRTNGLGMLGSTLLSSAQAVLWEYLIEFREYPSINDLIVSSFSGLEIGEPLWQIGQLWRGGVLTVGDRVKTTLFSPFDGAHDAVRTRQTKWWRPRAWRTIAFDAGGLRRRLDDAEARTEFVIGGDIDVVNDPRYVSPGPQHHRIRPGTWSRIRGRLSLGDAGSSTEIVGVQVASRTSIVGDYQHDADGDGRFFGLGAGFTYHRDRLADAWDHVAIFHLLGPQLQLARRTPGLALRWDVAMYGDFALIDAHVFSPTPPFPRPPPYVSTIQANGYYDGAGVSVASRLRFETTSWSLDAEVDGHRIWQLDFGDRVQDVEARSTTGLANAHGVSDVRLYWRAQLGYRVGRFGIAGTVEGSHLRSSWEDLEQQSSLSAVGLLARVDL